MNIHKSKTLRYLFALGLIVLTACKPDPARMEFVKTRAYDLGAKLGDSPTTRLAERGEYSTPVSGSDQYYLSFTTQETHDEFETRLAKLGKIAVNQPDSMVAASDPMLPEIGRTTNFTRTGAPLQTYYGWSIDEIGAIIEFYETSSFTSGTYFHESKPIRDNIVLLVIRRKPPVASTATPKQ